jgi:RNA polymerase sigma-70 factor (ECF subfamily)
MMQNQPMTTAEYASPRRARPPFLDVDRSDRAATEAKAAALDRDLRDRCGVLLGLIASGDDRAMVELMLVTRPVVFAAALRVLGDRARAEDTAQETYFQVWTSAGTFDSDRGTPHAWLATLARRRAIDRSRSDTASARRDTAYTASHFDRAHDGVWEAVWTNADNDLLTKALIELTSLQRSAVDLVYFQGLSCREAAERLGVPHATVKTRVRDAVLRLRLHLARTA